LSPSNRARWQPSCIYLVRSPVLPYRKALDMSTQNVSQNAQRDIFDVMREIEASHTQATVHANDAKAMGEDTQANVPDPKALCDSLKKKRELLGLLEGYAEAKDLVGKKEDLEEAIEFLEELGLALKDR